MDVFLAQPRGFCAGVRRAISLVEKTLSENGAPIYIRHEIVHNKHIIEDLKQRGVIFIDDLDEITDKTRPVIFSAHGVAKAVRLEAKAEGLHVLDAICPLVETVHRKILQLEEKKAEIIIIGKATHPEIIGTVGQLDKQTDVHIINSLAEAEKLAIAPDKAVGIITQTTLSVDETKDIIKYLQHRFTNIINKTQPNICFATTNRQKAMRKLVEKTQNILIIGSKNSSNSLHLREAALKFGAKQAWLIDDAGEADWSALDKCDSVGISAGASAPEYLVEELLAFFKKRYDNINFHDVIVIKENISFK